MKLFRGLGNIAGESLPTCRSVRGKHFCMRSDAHGADRGNAGSETVNPTLFTFSSSVAAAQNAVGRTVPVIVSDVDLQRH